MSPETLDQITAVFGWMTVINMVLYLYAAFFVVFKRAWMAEMHVRMLGVPQEQLLGRYFSYLANYKLLIITLNLTPWLALKIAG
jgi:hypothetical protein